MAVHKHSINISRIHPAAGFISSVSLASANGKGQAENFPAAVLLLEHKMQACFFHTATDLCFTSGSSYFAVTTRGSGEHIACFALLICLASALQIKLSSSQHSFLASTLLILSLVLLGVEERTSSSSRLSCWLRLNHNIYKPPQSSRSENLWFRISFFFTD